MNIYDIFTSEFEATFEQTDDYSFRHAFESPELDLPNVIREGYDSISAQLELEQTFETDKASIDNNGVFHYIQSIVGDDEDTTTDCPVLGPLLLSVGPLLLGIKLSAKDCGISRYISNFAEGWTLIPPSIESSFEAVNRRHRGTGVAIVLDPPKLKHLSPVRKQSQLWELDLESKISSIAKAAGWTNKSWFTYDYHQMSYLMATAIFDFEDSIKFPYLYQTEGGCGGLPPYGNLETAYSAMHYYCRGRARKGILGIMTESYLVNIGYMSPKDTFFLRSSHLALMGDKAWLKYETAYRSLLTEDATPLDIKDLLNSELDPIPEDLRLMGQEVMPNSFIEGHSISLLREQGYLMTELDIRSTLNSIERERAIGGSEPMRVVLEKLDSNYRLYKSNHLKLLSEISSSNRLVKTDLSDRLGAIPETFSPELLEVLRNYYSIRSASYSRFSSFFYTDAVRVFKTEDVKAYFQRNRSALLNDFGQDLDIRPNIFLDENYSLRADQQIISDWFNSDSLNNLLNRPLPPGLGVDDYRVVTTAIYDAITASEGKEYFNTIFIILFSSDRQLGDVLNEMLKYSFKDHKTICLTIRADTYVNLCLNGYKYQRLPNGANRRYYSGNWPMFFNYLTRRDEPIPEIFLKECLRRNHASTQLLGRVLMKVEYDYPNLERLLENYKPGANRELERVDGGFLSKNTLETFRARQLNWSATPIAEIYDWAEFYQEPVRINAIPDKDLARRAKLQIKFGSESSNWRRFTVPLESEEDGEG
jgi:hypothetical protein